MSYGLRLLGLFTSGRRVCIILVYPATLSIRTWTLLVFIERAQRFLPQLTPSTLALYFWLTTMIWLRGEIGVHRLVCWLASASGSRAGIILDLDTSIKIFYFGPYPFRALSELPHIFTWYLRSLFEPLAGLFVHLKARFYESGLVLLSF